MDDFQCSDSFSDDEMLDDALHSQYDELTSSLAAVDAADVTSSKPDLVISPVLHASRDQTASPNLASSPGLVGYDESVFASRVHPPADQQQTVFAASPEEVTPTTGTSVVAKIENIFEAMADVLLNERGQLSVELVTRPRVSRQHHGTADSTSAQSVAVQRLCFPGKTEREAWRFGEHDLAASACSYTDWKTAVVVRILELVHEALLSDVVLSKRYH
jgi:meiotic recombination protein SPO11